MFTSSFHSSVRNMLLNNFIACGMPAVQIVHELRARGHRASLDNIAEHIAFFEAEYEIYCQEQNDRYALRCFRDNEKFCVGCPECPLGGVEYVKPTN